MAPFRFVLNRFLQTGQQQQRGKEEGEQRTVIHPCVSKAVIAIEQVLADLGKVADGKQKRAVVDRRIHRFHREGYPCQRSPQRPDHRHDANNDTEHGKEGKDKQGQRLCRHHKQDRRQVERPEAAREGDVQEAEHHVVRQYAHQAEDDGIGQ